MAGRLSLHEELKKILGSENVYFQPPESVKMRYPAIVYSLSDITNTFADDLPYANHIAYEIIVIDKNPDNDTIKKIMKLPLCRFNRHYTSDNLNHDAFTLYY